MYWRYEDAFKLLEEWRDSKSRLWLNAWLPEAAGFRGKVSIAELFEDKVVLRFASAEAFPQGSISLPLKSAGFEYGTPESPIQEDEEVSQEVLEMFSRWLLLRYHSSDCIISELKPNALP